MVPLMKHFGNDLSLCARRIVEDPDLQGLIKAYSDLGEVVSSPQIVETLLGMVKPARIIRGRRPTMERIRSAARGLLREWEALSARTGRGER